MGFLGEMWSNITCNTIRWSFLPKKKTHFLLFHNCAILCSLIWLCTHCNHNYRNFEYYLKLLIMVFTTTQVISVLLFLLEVVLSIDPKTKEASQSLNKNQTTPQDSSQHFNYNSCMVGWVSRLLPRVSRVFYPRIW